MNTRLKRLEGRKKKKTSKELVYLSIFDGVYYQGILNAPDPSKVVSDEDVDSLFWDDSKLVMIIDFSKAGSVTE